MRMRQALAILALTWLTALTGCGDTEVDSGKAERLVRDNLTGPPPESVECPDGVDAEPGATFECQVRLPDGRGATVTVHVEDDDGYISIGPGDVRER
jgi:hypothetical protein